MVNTTRASLMAQLAELRWFNIITSDEEQVMIKKVDAWDNAHNKMMTEVNKVANEILNK